MVVNDEGFSDLRGGLYTPLGTANIDAVQVDIDVNENPEYSVGCGSPAVRPRKISGASTMPQTLNWGLPSPPPIPRSWVTGASLYPSKHSSGNRRRKRRRPPG